MLSVEVATDADVDSIAALFRALNEWDTAQSLAMGIPAELLADTFYATTEHELIAQCREPGSQLFIARWDGRPAGCVAYSPFDADSLELHRVFVDPAFRGKGIGRRLLEMAISDAATTGRSRMLIQTAIFMRDAIALYRALGFAPCPRYRESPPAIAPAEVFMSRPL